MDTVVGTSASRDNEQASPDSLLEIAKRTFLAWEKLRIGYLAILVMVTLLLSLLDPGGLWYSVHFWFLVIEGVVVANICYFAGPAVETYVTWLGACGSWLRLPLFAIGTLFACLLSFAAVATQLMPDMG